MKTTIISLLCLVCSLNSFSQEIEVPKDYELKVAADYEKYESELLQCIAWLKATPIGEEDKKQLKAIKFVMDWVEGSPDVSVVIDMNLLNFLDSSPHMLFYFIAGWTEKSVMTEKHGDVSANAMAGIEMVISVYKNNRDVLEKDKTIEKLIKMQDKGKLQAHVDKKMAAHL